MSKVLLINDSRFESVIMKDLLTGLNFEVLICNENQAVEHLSQTKFDYAIVNYIMPSLRGDQLIGIIKAQAPDVRCVLSSNKCLDKNMFRHKKVDSILQTPTNGTKLLETFKEADHNVNERKIFSVNLA